MCKTEQHRLKKAGNSLCHWQSLAYACPVLASSFLFSATSVVQGIYAKHYGLKLTEIASILLICRLFDAITDPVVGYLSDRYYLKTGSRKIFVILGALLFVGSSYLLFTPPSGNIFTYFLLAFLLYYLSWTIFEIPHLAWVNDFTQYTNERTRVFSYRVVMANIGYLLFYAVPHLPIFETPEITPDTLQWSASYVGLFMLPLVYCCVRFAPSTHGETQRIKNGRSSQSNSKHNSMGFLEMGVMVLSNKPYLMLLIAYFFSMTGTGMFVTLQFIFIDTYLGLSKEYSIITIGGIAMGIAGVWCWYQLAERIGNKLSWAAGMLFCCLGLFVFGFLSPSSSPFVVLLALLPIFFGLATTGALVYSILSATVDYSTWKYQKNYAGTYFSIFTIVAKANLAIGGSLAFFTAGIFGFDPSLTTHTPENIFGLRLAAAWLPMIITLLSVALILLIPMNNRRHDILRKALDRRSRFNAFDKNAAKLVISDGAGKQNAISKN